MLSELNSLILQNLFTSKFLIAAFTYFQIKCDAFSRKESLILLCIFLFFNRKSYEQIETAFLTAKTTLFKAREKKELLVEHLNIIISNNEDRKAKKLSELMEKVGLTPLGETVSAKDDESLNRE